MKSIDSTVTLRLQEARFELGLTLEEVAHGICSVSYLSMIEAGKRSPSAKVYRALCYRLGVQGDAGNVSAELSGELTKALFALRLGKTSEATQLVSEMSDQAESDFVNARVCELKGDLNTALELFQKVYQNDASHTKLRIMSAISLVRCEGDLSDFHRAIQVGEEALVRFEVEKALFSDELMELRAVLAGIYQDLGDLSRALTLVSNVIENGFESPWSKVIQLWTKCTVLEASGKSVEAAEVAAEALLLIETLDRPIAKANLLQTHAYLKLKSGHFDAAEIEDELKTAEALFGPERSHPEIANLLDTQSLAAALRGEKDVALRLSDKSLSLLSGQQTSLCASILVSRANTLRLIDEPELMKQSLLEARRILETLKAGRAEAKSWRLMAEIYESLGDSESVIACLKAATDLLGLGSSTLVLR